MTLHLRLLMVSRSGLVRTSFTRRAWGALGALALVALPLTGCAGAGDEPGTSGIGVPGGAPGSAGGNTGGMGPAGAQPGAGPTQPPGGDGTRAPSPGANTPPMLDAKCGAVSQMAENVLQPVDIIFGIDTSGSMAEEVAEVQKNLNAFSQQIIAAGIDVRVIMLASPKGAGAGSGGYAVDGPCIAPPLGSGQCPADSKPPTYVHLDMAKVTSWDVLDVFAKSYPDYKPHLRENSLKNFVAISDDDATSQNNPAGILVSGIFGNSIGLVPTIDTAAKFTEAVRALDPSSLMWTSWRYNGIFAFTGTCPSAAGGGAEGKVHRELVMQTGGVAGDLCLQNFAPVFDQLARQVTATVSLACDWAIPPPPDGKAFDSNKTNVQLTLDGKAEALGKVPAGKTCDDRGGWRYDNDAKPSKVIACPASCKRIQGVGSKARIDVLFGCETVILL